MNKSSILLRATLNKVFRIADGVIVKGVRLMNLRTSADIGISGASG